MIGTLPFSDAQITDAARLDPGEPQPCGAIGATVWYRFTPGATMVLDVDTYGTPFDTVLAVYTGFEATTRTTYWIQAGGFDGDQGELQVNGREFGQGSIPDHRMRLSAPRPGGLECSHRRTA